MNYFKIYIMHNIAALHVIPACDTAAPLSNQLQQNLPNSFTVSKIYNYGGLGCSVVQWLHPGIDRLFAVLSYVNRRRTKMSCSPSSSVSSLHQSPFIPRAIRSSSLKIHMKDMLLRRTSSIYGEAYYLVILGPIPSTLDQMGSFLKGDKVASCEYKNPLWTK